MTDVSAALAPSGYADGFARANLPPFEEWPEFRFDLPELQYPPRLNCVAELLDTASLRGWDERTALIGSRERLSYAALRAGSTASPTCCVKTSSSRPAAGCCCAAPIVR